MKVSKVFLNIQRVKYLENYMKYLRAIFFESGLFTMQEICDSSITGAPNRFVEVARPALSPIKLNAIKRRWFYLSYLNFGFDLPYFIFIFRTCDG